MVKVPPRAGGSFRDVSQTIVSAAAVGGLLLSPLGGAAQPIDTTQLVPPDAELSSHGFTNIRGVRELEDGRILLTDSRERRLVVVDLATSEVQPIGRTGEGPGEYQYPGHLYAVRGDTSLLTDVGTRRWFLLEGIDIVETFPPGRVANRMLGAGLSGVDRRGRVLGVEGYGYSQVEIPGARGTADSLRVWLIGGLSEDPAMETIARIGGRARGGISRYSDGPYRYIAPNPLATEEQAQLFPDGWIAVARTDPYRVDWRRPDGSWVRGEPLPSPPIEVDEAERCLVFERAGGAAPSPNCEDDRLPPFPEELPPFLPSALLPAPDGRLLVERTPSAKVPGRRYDLVDRNGVLTEVLVLPEDRQIVAFGPTSVYVIRTDELDLQWLTRHPFG